MFNNAFHLLIWCAVPLYDMENHEILRGIATCTYRLDIKIFTEPYTWGLTKKGALVVTDIFLFANLTSTITFFKIKMLTV